MEAEIDLIPTEERVRRSKEKAKKIALIACIVLFVVTLGASIGLYYYINGIDNKISSLNQEIEAKRAKIKDKSPIEIAARNLDSKFKVLSDLLSSRLYTSLFLEELSSRTPSSISILSLDSSVPETVSLSGSAVDYISLAKFLNSLADPKLASSSASVNGQNMFKEVLINTVTLDPLDSKPKFNLSLTLDTNLLKKN